MSNLEELIKEFCPNGVEYVKIKDVFTRLKGTSITAGKMKEIETSNGEIKIFAGGKTVINANECDIPNANITRVPAVLVQSRGVIDFIYYDQPFTFKNEMWAYTAKNIITVKYLYYVLKNNVQYFRESASGMGALPQISLGVTEDFIVPLPALPVQREIVRILDSFTLYSAELTAELTARRKQYEFYRDKLLNFTCNIIRTNIGQVCNVFTGGEPPVDHIKGDVPTGEYKYPIWGNGKDIYGYSKTFQIGQDAVVISSIGANTGAVYFRKANFTPIIRLKVLTPKNNDINIRYLFYYLSNKKIESKSSSVPNMNSNEIKQLSIEIPPIEVQERIVKVLDNFDAICSDLGIGLPAEIEKRQKQYEYYRDKLLSFDINVDKVINTTGGATAN